MKLVAVEKVPERRENNKLQKLIKDFADSNAKVVKITLGDREYASLESAYSVIGNACRRSKRPIKIHRRGDELYLAKIS